MKKDYQRLKAVYELTYTNFNILSWDREYDLLGYINGLAICPVCQSHSLEVKENFMQDKSEAFCHICGFQDYEEGEDKAEYIPSEDIVQLGLLVNMHETIMEYRRAI